MLGFGSVGRCTLPLLVRHLKVPMKNITVVEADDNTTLFRNMYGSRYGINYAIEEITRFNIDDVLNKYLKKGDFLVNLSTDIDGITIVDWCQNHGVLYLDTSIENWPGDFQSENYKPGVRTLYDTHQTIRKKARENWSKTGPTAIVTHGANPGLVSHFTKAALLDIAEAMGMNYTKPTNKEEWADLSMRTGTKVIHISERDTQISNVPKKQDEFVNTWSVEGFWAEGVSPAELGWGTHEKWLPPGGHFHSWGPGNAIYLNQPGAATMVRSWVPLGGPIIGYCIQHSESITISDYLTVWKDDDPIYCPTVHYAYHPCDAAIVSMHELQMRNWEMQPEWRIMNDDIISGIDELGVLLMGHGVNAWWYGSQLGIDETRELVPGQNGTTLHVAASVLAAVLYAMKNPKLGYVEPDEIPHEEILGIANQYLGPIETVQSNWTPLTDRSPLFKSWELRDFDHDDMWQFRNFLVQ